MKHVCLGLILCFMGLPVFATNYYVDASSASASDSNSGTSMSAPLKTLNAVNSRTFAAGDVISFRRGTSYSGVLLIKSSGNSSSRILYTAYGDGAAPVISNTGQYSNCIQIQSSYVTVENLKLIDAQEGAIRVTSTGNNNIIRNIEATNVGIGVTLAGQYNLLHNMYLHDLKMVVNTVGGDDDYGANGFVISAPNNELAFNRCIRCIAPSYDYGTDGGMFELYGTTDNTYIHHNIVIDSDGLFEVGGNPGYARNVRIAYNEVVNSKFGGIHAGGTFAATVSNFRIENNTVVDTTARSTNLSALFWVGYSVPTDAVIVRNNIFAIRSFNNVFQQQFTRANNIYYLLNSATGIVGGSRALASGEMLTDPKFVDMANGDVHLLSTSPAIDRALSIGYTMDTDGNPISGAAPDIGTYEFQYQTSPTPTEPAPAPAPADTTKPTVGITSPSSGTVKVRTYVPIQVSATDNVAVTQVNISVNGSLICSVKAAPYSCNWYVPRKAGRTYQIQATAIDAAGNQSSAVKSVTSQY